MNSNLVDRRTKHFIRIVVVFLVSGCSSISIAADSKAMHEQMLQAIAEDFRRTAYLTGRREMRPDTERALRHVARHEFVASNSLTHAYLNRPLGIGHGQTISQPYIVALMTDLLELHDDLRVLEIGTGSGYQAAVLAEIVAEVYSVEIIPALADKAQAKLTELGYDNIKVKTGDGNLGWVEEAPFDRIIVTAGGRLPPALIEQLKPGGRLVIPLNVPGGDQDLTLITKSATGTVNRESVLPVRFVPLTGDNR